MSKKISLKESKREFLGDSGVRHPHIQVCVQCGHSYVDLPPSNTNFHQKSMTELSELTGLKEVYLNHQTNPDEFPILKDNDDKMVQKLPRKSVVLQLLLRCHCIKLNGRSIQIPAH